MDSTREKGDIEMRPRSSTSDETMTFLSDRPSQDMLSEARKESMANLLPTPATQSTRPPASASEKLVTAAWILLNGAATVAIVFLNKAIFTTPSSKHMQITTAAWHLLTTYLVLLISSSQLQLFTPKRLSLRQMAPICILFTSYLVFGNLSLTYNPVSTYQLAKILTVPCVVAFSYILFRKTISSKKVATVCAACIGVGLATANSPSGTVTVLGAGFAVASFMSTALYQIWIGKSLADADVSPPQLLMNQAPLSLGMLVVLIPAMDTLPKVDEISTSALTCFLVSGVVAALINLSSFQIIGRTSTLTFNIAGIVKTVLTLAIGWVVEGKSFAFLEVSGVLLALSASFAYSHIRD